MGVKIHRLEPTDWPRLKLIRLAALADAPDAFGSTYAQAQSYAPTDWQRQLHDLATFVANIGARDVGMVRGTLEQSNPSCGLLISMWVAPPARGCGVGEQLILAVADWARGRGLTELFLDVADDNKPAIDLYKRMNFLPTGETGALPAPRTHILEHRRVLAL